MSFLFDNRWDEVQIPDTVLIVQFTVCSSCWTVLVEHGEWVAAWDAAVPEGWHLCSGNGPDRHGHGVVECQLCGQVTLDRYTAYGLKGQVRP